MDGSCDPSFRISNNTETFLAVIILIISNVEKNKVNQNLYFYRPLCKQMKPSNKDQKTDVVDSHSIFYVVFEGIVSDFSVTRSSRHNMTTFDTYAWYIKKF